MNIEDLLLYNAGDNKPLFTMDTEIFQSDTAHGNKPLTT
jgi:hypothetical protein